MRRFGRGKMHGRFILDSSRERLPDGEERSYQPLLLASARQEELGLAASWDLLIPKGSWPERANDCNLSVHFYARDELALALESENQPTHELLRPLARLPLPEGAEELAKVLDSAHEDTLVLEPATPEVLLYLAAEPSSTASPDGRKRWLRAGVKPSVTSREDYRKAIEAELSRLSGL